MNHLSAVKGLLPTLAGGWQPYACATLDLLTHRKIVFPPGQLPQHQQFQGKKKSLKIGKGETGSGTECSCSLKVALRRSSSDSKGNYCFFRTHLTGENRRRGQQREEVSALCFGGEHPSSWCFRFACAASPSVTYDLEQQLTMAFLPVLICQLRYVARVPLCQELCIL